LEREDWPLVDFIVFCFDGDFLEETDPLLDLEAFTVGGFSLKSPEFGRDPRDRVFFSWLPS